jgi:hypothetical protein
LAELDRQLISQQRLLATAEKERAAHEQLLTQLRQQQAERQRSEGHAERVESLGPMLGEVREEGGRLDVCYHVGTATRC